MESTISPALLFLVCTNKIQCLSNADIKLLLANYDILSPKQQKNIREFCEQLQETNINRYTNLYAFIEGAILSKRKIIRNGSPPAPVPAPAPAQAQAQIFSNITDSGNNECDKQQQAVKLNEPFYTNITKNSNSLIKTNPVIHNNNISSLAAVYPYLKQTIMNNCILQNLSQLVQPSTIGIPWINNNAISITSAFNGNTNMQSNFVDKSNLKNRSKSYISNCNNKTERKGMSSKKELKQSKDIENEPLKSNNINDETLELGEIPENDMIYETETWDDEFESNQDDSIDMSSDDDENDDVDFDSITTSNNDVKDLKTFSEEYMKKRQEFVQSIEKGSDNLNLSSTLKEEINNKTNVVKPQDNVIIKQEFLDNCSKKQKRSAIKSKILIPPAIKVEAPTIKSEPIEKYEKTKNFNNKSVEHFKFTAIKNSFLDECNQLKQILSKNSKHAKSKMEGFSLNSKLGDNNQDQKGKKQNKYRDLDRVKESDKILYEFDKIHKKVTKKRRYVDDRLIEKSRLKCDENTLKGDNTYKKDTTIKSEDIPSQCTKEKIPQTHETSSIQHETPFSANCNRESRQESLAEQSSSFSHLDLTVLLRYFYKLESHEQHHLIEYLKTLELTEPELVAELRNFVRTTPSDDEDKGTGSSTENTSVFQTNTNELKNVIIVNDEVESHSRPDSRTSNLSNIDCILDDIDSILDENSSDDERKSKRLKFDSDDEADEEVIKNVKKNVEQQLAGKQNINVAKLVVNQIKQTPVKSTEESASSCQTIVQQNASVYNNDRNLQNNYNQFNQQFNMNNQGQYSEYYQGTPICTNNYQFQQNLYYHVMNNFYNNQNHNYGNMPGYY